MSRINILSCGIILFYLFANVNNLTSSGYYVDNSHPRASDSNSGSAESPWLTIQHAADILKAGDVCFVKEGAYYERITPANSGQSINLITFKAVGDVIIPGFNLSNRQYIRIIGFEFTHNNTSAQYEAITMSSSNGCEIMDNYFHHTYSLGIWMRQDTPTNHVLISGNKLTYIGMVAGHEVGNIAIKIWGNNNIVEYNDISHVADFLNVWGEKNIIRNNYFYDCYYSDFPDYHVEGGHHIDGFQYWSDNRMLLTSTLVENNFFVDNVVQHAHIVILRDLTNTGSSHFIFRNNVGVRNGAYTLMVEHLEHVKVFNNTFVDVLCAQSPKALYCASFLDYTNYCSVINNVFYNTVRDGGRVYIVDSESEHGFYGDYNFAFNSNNPNSNWSAPISNEIHGILNQDPRFTNYTNDDFHLQHNSPCIGAAGPLTTTANSGSGLDISVIDAGYFFDGWGITDGDYIRVGSNDSLKIVAIDYDNNIITVNRTVSWNNQDNVNLVYQGTAPDIGAFEYRADENYQFDVKILRPFNGSRVNGIVEIEIEATNEECIRHVIFFVNGLPEILLSKHQYKYLWNTENLPLGEYKIEARAYAYHASSNLTQSDGINLTVVDNNIISPSNLRFIK